MPISFSRYKAVIYDTNCIMYYLFYREEKSRDGRLVIIDSPGCTAVVRELTRFLKDRNIKVRTIVKALEEITEDKLSQMISKRISNENLRTQLGLVRGEKFPEDIEFQINRKLRSKAKSLESESWFELDRNYKVDWKFYEKITDFFKNKQKLYGCKDVPDEVDKTLILYSQFSTLPLVSNDHHIYDYRTDLEQESYAHKIVKLMECTTDNLM